MLQPSLSTKIASLLLSLCLPLYFRSLSVARHWLWLASLKLRASVFHSTLSIYLTKEEDSMMRHHSEAEDTSVWVQCGWMVFWKILASRQKLTDQDANNVWLCCNYSFWIWIGCSQPCTSSATKASEPTHACFNSSTPVDSTVLLQSLHSVSLEKSGHLTQCTYHWMMKHIKLSRECLAITQVPFEWL